jgi:hypothetical protein
LIDYNNPIDERTYHIVQNKNHIANNESNNDNVQNVNWCQPNRNTNGKTGHTVLYIPGHEGTYKQARSLAAHGIHLSQKNFDYGDTNENIIRTKLSNGTMDKISNTIHNFVYDVYTIDFNNGEGNAWHASRLYSQADFVVRCIERLVEECSVSVATLMDEDGSGSGSESIPFVTEGFDNSITIVAHSLGGIVARKAILTLHEKWTQNAKKSSITSTNPQNGVIVKNVITLASPHQFIPFVLEPTLVRFLESLQEDELKMMKNHQYETTFVSFSGGLRDELIPQYSSFIDHLQSNNDTILSVLASDVMPFYFDSIYSKGEVNDGIENRLRLGMDHQCIVWCHGLLSVVGELVHLFTLSFHESKMNREEQISQFLRKKMNDNSGLSCNSNTLHHGNVDGDHDKKGHQCNENDCNYDCRVKMKEQLLTNELGLMRSIAIQAAMLFNVRPLMLLFALNAICYQLLLIIFIRKQEIDPIIKKRLKFLASCYCICPFITSNLYCQVQDNDSMNWKVVTMQLSYVAMTLHHIILYALIPLVKWLYMRGRMLCWNARKAKRFGNSINSTTQSSLSLQQIRMIMISSLFHGIVCLTQSLLLGKDGWVSNTIAILSHFVIIFNIVIMLNICSLGFKDIVHLDDNADSISHVATSYINNNIILHSRMIFTLMMPIFPMVLFGKLIFWSSLLTTEGQWKAIQYIQTLDDCYHQVEMDKKSNISNCSLMSVIYQYDFNFVTNICIPLYMILVLIQFVKNEHGRIPNDTKKLR